jgi:hypothetical protein
LDRPFFYKNDILKQKRIGASEPVRRNLKQCTKGQLSARIAARRRRRRSEEGKAGGRLIRNLYQRTVAG